MNPEKQRIAIAEFCGWRLRPYGDMLVWYNPQGHACPIERGHRNDCIPDYINDLNAIHKAEKLLTDEQWLKYCKNLDQVVPYKRHAGNIHANAAQRAEALLKTIGKWEE